MTLTLGANPIRVTISGSAPGPQGPVGVGVTGLTVDGEGRLIGQLSDGTATAPVQMVAGPAGAGIAGVTLDQSGNLLVTLTTGAALPPIDLSGLFASGVLLSGQDGSPVLTQDGTFLGTLIEKAA